MKKILGLILGAYSWTSVLRVYAVEKFEILPDLPEPIAAAQASSVSTSAPDIPSGIAAQTIGQEPNILSVILSLVFVILLIYATGIIYAKLNKVGYKTLKKQIADSDNSRVSVISTTPLGNNKTLHVVELDGKRMLIGASNNSIDLIKDLGSYTSADIEEGEYSKIEIPNIRIPKIEIPKIEFPNIGFTKTSRNNQPKEQTKSENQEQNDDNFVISEIYEESSDGIIDKLFTPSKQENKETEIKEEPDTSRVVHSVDPEEYALYKKYL